MPTYEYECHECKQRFEVFQKMTDEPVKECPKCSGNVRKLFGAGVGIIFKGSGFYVNDYKQKSCASSSCGTKQTATEANKDSNKTNSSCSECKADKADKAAS